MNIQEFIKAKEEEYRKFLKEYDIQVVDKYPNSDPESTLFNFFSQSLLEYNEKIKEMIESEKWILIEGKLAPFQKDLNKALDDIITNLIIKE